LLLRGLLPELLYEQLVPHGVEGAYENALSAYESARGVNPFGPDIVLVIARLEGTNAAVTGGTSVSARELIGEALALKSNYTDAIFLLSQIEVQEGDLAGAIRSVEAATLISPNNPVVFFQLGILQYNALAFDRAVVAFESATRLNPVYANAKYFLGLSYDQVGRRDDAIPQFEDVLTLNPDSQEVIFILGNLKSNLDPFSNVEPPLDDEPENRVELPVSEPITDDGASDGDE